jgi:uncharacterized protein YndB with AHSA1/START domain
MGAIAKRWKEIPMKLVKAAEVSTTIHAAKERVWHALTTPAAVKKYFFGADLETTWKVGSPIAFSGEFKGKAYRDTGTVKSFAPNEELSYTHWSPLSGQPDAPENHHLVTISLRSDGPHTKVTLNQQNQDGKPVEPDTQAHFEENWKQVLAGLKKTVEG